MTSDAANEVTSVDEILNFWFGDSQLQDISYQQRRKLWFAKDPAFDAAIRSRFQSVYQRSIAGTLADWQRFPQGCLALVLLFDQFPRNMFRGTAQAFAADPQALQLAERAIAQGFDQALLPIQRLFIYLPFEHSENLEHQQRSIALFSQLVAANPEFADALDYAKRHQQVIERFGRFPHRNVILDRVATPAEAEFLQQRGASF